MTRQHFLLLDVLRGDRFVCQVRYPLDRCRAVVTDTAVERVADLGDVEAFVRQQRPSQRWARDLRILPADA